VNNCGGGPAQPYPGAEPSDDVCLGHEGRE
jgi:hypothetical protein